MAIVITLDRMLQERGMTLSELAGRIARLGFGTPQLVRE